MPTSIQIGQYKQQGFAELIKHLESIRSEKGNDWNPTYSEFIEEVKKYSKKIGYVPVKEQRKQSE